MKATGGQLSWLSGAVLLSPARVCGSPRGQALEGIRTRARARMEPYCGGIHSRAGSVGRDRVKKATFSSGCDSDSWRSITPPGPMGCDDGLGIGRLGAETSPAVGRAILLILSLLRGERQCGSRSRALWNPQGPQHHATGLVDAGSSPDLCRESCGSSSLSPRQDCYRLLWLQPIRRPGFANGDFARGNDGRSFKPGKRR